MQDHSFAQSLVQDTLYVSFPSNENLQNSPGIVIDSIQYVNQKDTRVLGIEEKKEFLIVPVDLYICTRRPLHREIASSLNLSRQTDNDSTAYTIVIDDFSLSQTSASLFYPCYSLNAALSLFRHGQFPDSDFIGQFLYETKKRKSLFRDNRRKAYEDLLLRWKHDFISDLNVIEASSPRDLRLMGNYRAHRNKSHPVHMMAGCNGIMTSENELLDVEIFFSDREARTLFYRNGGYNIRFRMADKFESIEFGLSNDYLFRRLSRTMVLRWQSQLMCGVNRWKDIRTRKRKIYDAVILDYSMSQNLIFNPIDRRHILFGIGIMEGINYIYSRNIHFEIGLLLHLGIKL